MSDLDQAAEEIVTIYNKAIPDYSPDIEWSGMGHDKETKKQYFVLEAEEYIDTDGIQALREDGKQITYIEAYEHDGVVSVQIEIAVPERVLDE